MWKQSPDPLLAMQIPSVVRLRGPNASLQVLPDSVDQPFTPVDVLHENSMACGDPEPSGKALGRWVNRSADDVVPNRHDEIVTRSPYGPNGSPDGVADD
jgi:hypothetical protein